MILNREEISTIELWLENFTENHTIVLDNLEYINQIFKEKTGSTGIPINFKHLGWTLSN